MRGGVGLVTDVLSRGVQLQSSNVSVCSLAHDPILFRFLPRVDFFTSWHTHHRKWVGASNRGNEVGPTHLPHPIEPRNNPEIVVWHSDSSAQLADSLMCRQKVPSSIPVGGNSKKSWSSFRKMHARNRTESRLRPQKSPLDLPTYPLMRVPASKNPHVLTPPIFFAGIVQRSL